MPQCEGLQQLQLWCLAWKVKSVMGKDWKTRQARRAEYWSCICTTCKFSNCKEESDAQSRYQSDNHANNLILQTVFWYILLGCSGLYIIHFACLWELHWHHSNQQYMGLLLLTLWKFYHCCTNFVQHTLRFSMSLTWLQCSNATLNGYFLTHRSGKWGLINDH